MHVGTVVVSANPKVTASRVGIVVRSRADVHGTCPRRNGGPGNLLPGGTDRTFKGPYLGACAGCHAAEPLMRHMEEPGPGRDGAHHRQVLHQRCPGWGAAGPLVGPRGAGPRPGREPGGGA